VQAAPEQGLAERVRLSGEQPLSSGLFRLTYRHPLDPTKVIKVARADRPSNIRLDPNERELRAYAAGHAAGAELERYFPRLHGFIDTDLGPGLCADLVQGSDGSSAVNLEQWSAQTSENGPSAQWVLDEYRKLAAFCTTYALFTSVDELHNVGFVRDGAGWRLVAYDLKLRAMREAIPLSIIPYFRRQKIARRFGRSIAALEKRLDARDQPLRASSAASE
jgi:hypothetical protein